MEPVVDFMIKKAVGAGMSAGWKKLTAMLSREETDKVYRELIEEVLFETQGFVQKLIAGVGGDPEKAIERLGATVTQKEAVALFSRLQPEAVYSATAERRRMLAAAMAGVFSPNFEVEQKSRITRVIAALEPSDIRILRQSPGAARFVAGPPPGYSASTAALLSTGCIREVVQKVGGGAQYEVTELGKWVLDYLRDWTPSSPESNAKKPSATAKKKRPEGR